MVSFQVRYTGRVQGVGFRNTAKAIACKHVVTGWVRNSADGGVELVVEGEPAEVATFLDKISERFRHQIEYEDRTPRTPTGEFTKFSVTE